MSNFDSFFSKAPDADFNARVLQSAGVELELNRVMKNRKRWLAFLAPLTAALATFFVFKLVNRNEIDLLAINSEQIEFIADLIEDEDALEIIDNLSLLEELELIEELEDGDV